MCMEIEAKLKIESPEQVERRLAELGAEFVAELRQTDYHFDDAKATLKKGDKALRIRRQVAADRTQLLMTYKGPKEESNFKKRQEIEFELADADAAEKLLAALGYHKALVVEKRRRLWRFGGCEVALDRLDLLGDYLEIEGSDDGKIDAVQENLGLSHLAHIPKSYAALLNARLRELNGEHRKSAH
ncbi:MAG: class IV adenylate cyclase [Sedimentisphaerales bacterium]|nr:class IV adenylate cyclase [Sedimentisphaerales bacterium]